MRLFLVVMVGLVACGEGRREPDDAGFVDDSGLVDVGGTVDGGTFDGGSCAAAPIPSVTFTAGTSGATTWYLARAATPRGLVVALHGTNGSATSVAQNKLEWQRFFNDALARGYSVLVPESEQRTSPRRWDNTPRPTNPDVVRIASLLDAAAASGALPAGAPVMVIGMSQGGGVAPLFGQLLASRSYPVRAVAVHSAAPTAVVSNAAYTLPTTFVAMGADPIVLSADTIAAEEALRQRSLPSALFVKPAEPVCPEAFTRIPGIEAAGSRAIFGGLVDAGVLTASGGVQTAGSDVDQSSMLAGVPPEFSAFTRAIDEQVQVAGARHAFFGGRAAQTLDFFDAHR